MRDQLAEGRDAAVGAGAGADRVNSGGDRGLIGGEGDADVHGGGIGAAGDGGGVEMRAHRSGEGDLDAGVR